MVGANFLFDLFSHSGLRAFFTSDFTNCTTDSTIGTIGNRSRCKRGPVYVLRHGMNQSSMEQTLQVAYVKYGPRLACIIMALYPAELEPQTMDD